MFKTNYKITICRSPFFKNSLAIRAFTVTICQQGPFKDILKVTIVLVDKNTEFLDFLNNLSLFIYI